MSDSLLAAAEREAKDANAWPSLVPLETDRVPDLPIDALGALAPMVRAVAYSLEVPPELPAGLALTVASGAAAHAFHVEVEDGYREPLQIWTAGVERSGGRKSATKERMAAPLYERERQMAADHARDAKRRTAQAEVLKAKAKDLVARAQKCKDLNESMRMADEAGVLEEQAEELQQPAQRLVIEDTTPEHLGTMLARNGERLTLICDEAGPFEQFAGRYKDKGAGPHMDLWLQAHAGGSVRVDRGSRDPVMLHAPKLALAVMPQPSVVAKLQAKDGFRGRGLLARFVWLLPRSLIGSRTFNRPPVDPMIEQEYARIVNRLLDYKPREVNP